MSTNPFDFVTNALKQPYPTMGMAPSAVPIKTGGTIVQSGSGSDGLGKTAQSMWARIADAVPFGWTLFGVQGAARVGSDAAATVKTKIEEGAQAVDGKVKSITDGVTSAITGFATYSKWIIVGLVAVAFIVFAAQVKTLVKS